MSTINKIRFGHVVVSGLRGTIVLYIITGLCVTGILGTTTTVATTVAYHVFDESWKVGSWNMMIVHAAFSMPSGTGARYSKCYSLEVELSNDCTIRCNKMFVCDNVR